MTAVTTEASRPRRGQARADADVVVIGAGFAGLDVIVLEARDRVGGRTWTDRRLGHDLELGGIWVHWVQPHIQAEMTRYGREITASPAVEEAYWLGAGDAPRAGTLDEFMALIGAGHQAKASADRLAALVDNVHFATRLPKHLIMGAVVNVIDRHRDEVGSRGPVGWRTVTCCDIRGPGRTDLARPAGGRNHVRPK